MTVKMRQHIERQIARRLIMDAKRAGYKMNIYNGWDEDEWEFPEPIDNTKALLEKMFQVDEERLYLFKGGERVGWVFFVYGNDGYDVISDYTTNLEHIMAGVDALSDKYGQ